MEPRRIQIAYTFPDEVNYVIRRLERAGKEAYVVGGAVRDILIGKVP